MNAMTIKSDELNLYFTKEVERLDFTVRLVDDDGRKCVVDGFVARVFGTDRYYVNSEALPIDFVARESDTLGKNETPFYKWVQTGGHFTLTGAIKHHLEKMWGIEITDKIVMPPKLQAYVRNEAMKKVVLIAMGCDFNGDALEHKIAAKEFAKYIVDNGMCFADKGGVLPKTIPIGVYNFDGDAVKRLWVNRMEELARVA